jgi:hypothetical protein
MPDGQRVAKGSQESHRLRVAVLVDSAAFAKARKPAFSDNLRPSHYHWHSRLRDFLEKIPQPEVAQDMHRLRILAPKLPTGTTSADCTYRFQRLFGSSKQSRLRDFLEKIPQPGGVQKISTNPVKSEAAARFPRTTEFTPLPLMQR